jgi:hypothetical protein
MRYRLYVRDAVSKQAAPPLDVEAATEEAARAQAADLGWEVLQVEAMDRAVGAPLTVDDVTRLRERVVQLERRLAASNLHSKSFLARAFAVWGHFVVAHLIIAFAIGIPLACLSAVVSGR